MNWLDFFSGKRNPVSTFEDPESRAQDIIEGKDPSSQTILDQKSEYTDAISKIKEQAKIVEKEAKKMSRMADTAIRIAIATGALHE